MGERLGPEDPSRVEHRQSLHRRILRRIPIIGRAQREEPLQVNPDNTPPVFNPYSDLNRFRREAFRRVPGVVNMGDPLRASMQSDDRPQMVPEQQAALEVERQELHD